MQTKYEIKRNDTFFVTLIIKLSLTNFEIKKKRNNYEQKKSSHISEIMDWLRSLVALLRSKFSNILLYSLSRSFLLFQFLFFIFSSIHMKFLLCNLEIFYGHGKNRIFKSKTRIKLIWWHGSKWTRCTCVHIIHNWKHQHCVFIHQTLDYFQYTRSWNWNKWEQKKIFGYEKSLSESTNKQVFCVNWEIEVNFYYGSNWNCKKIYSIRM